MFAVNQFTAETSQIACHWLLLLDLMLVIFHIQWSDRSAHFHAVPFWV